MCIHVCSFLLHHFGHTNQLQMLSKGFPFHTVIKCWRKSVLEDTTTSIFIMAKFNNEIVNVTFVVFVSFLMGANCALLLAGLVVLI